MKREIKFFPAYDRTHPDPKKNYGVNCLELRFLVLGERGIVEFQLLTNWYNEQVENRRFARIKIDIISGKEDYLVRHFNAPYPADVCYYSLTRMSEDDAFFDSGVSYVFDNSPCFYGYKYTDDDGLVAKDRAFRLLVDFGEDALWKYLESYYKEVFGELR